MRTGPSNLITLIKRAEACLAGEKLTVPTRLHSSVAKPVLRTKMLLHPFLTSKHQPTRFHAYYSRQTPGDASSERDEQYLLAVIDCVLLA